MCGTRVAFRLQHHEDAEVIARNFIYPMLDFTELSIEVDRDDGYEYVVLSSLSVSSQHRESFAVTDGQSHAEGQTTSSGTTTTRSTGESTSKGKSQGRSAAAGITKTKGRSWGTSKTQGTSATQSHGNTSDTTETSGDAFTQNSSSQSGHGATHGIRGDAHRPDRSHNLSWTHGNGEAVSSQRSTSERSGQSQSQSQGNTESEGSFRSRSFQNGESFTAGLSDTETESHGTNTASSVARNRASSKSRVQTTSISKTTGSSEATGESHSLALAPLKKTRVEIQSQGRLRTSVEDQFAKVTSMLTRLRVRECVVAVADFNQAFPLLVDHVDDPFLVDRAAEPSEDIKHHRVAAMLRATRAMHSYNLPLAVTDASPETIHSERAENAVDSPFSM
jgi:hypothetical protein